MKTLKNIILSKASLEGMNQSDVAEKVGMSQPGLWLSLEKNTIKFNILLKVCKAVDADIHEVIDEFIDQ